MLQQGMLALWLHKAIETHGNDVFLKLPFCGCRVSSIINHHGYINTIISLIERVDIIKDIHTSVERV